MIVVGTGVLEVVLAKRIVVNMVVCSRRRRTGDENC